MLHLAQLKVGNNENTKARAIAQATAEGDSSEFKIFNSLANTLSMAHSLLFVFENDTKYTVGKAKVNSMSIADLDQTR
jgi:hypothetical protein